MPFARLFGRGSRRRLSDDVPLAKILKLKAADQERLLWEAHARLDSGEFAEAGRLFDLFSRLWPNVIDGRLGLAASRAALGDLDAAEAACVEALAIDPKNPYALLNAWEVAHRRGDEASASARSLAVDEASLPDELKGRRDALRALSDRPATANPVQPEPSPL